MPIWWYLWYFAILVMFEILIIIIVLFNSSFLNGLSNYSAISGMGFKGFLGENSNEIL